MNAGRETHTWKKNEQARRARKIETAVGIGGEI